MVSIGAPSKELSGGLRVLQVGGAATGYYVREWHNQTTYAMYPQQYLQAGHELVIPSGLSAERAEFVKRYLIPTLPEQSFRRSVFEQPAGADGDNWTPLLENADGYAIAVIYQPHKGAHEVWYLPEKAIDVLEPALDLAFAEWNTQDPKRFPASPNWTSDARWMSAQQQREIEVVRTGIDVARTQVAELNAVIETAEITLDSLIRDSAKSPQRRLLTDNDATLVDAVQHALTEFGFTVVDLDEQLSPGEPRMGDLSVSDGDWTAIAEIKGYTKGAKSNDLLTVGRHRRVYEKKNRDVQRMWYIANSFRLDDPSSRPQILDGADEHTEDFARDDGLAIDTRDLFDLLKQIESGQLEATSAREALKSQTGRLTLD